MSAPTHGPSGPEDRHWCNACQVWWADMHACAPIVMTSSRFVMFTDAQLDLMRRWAESQPDGKQFASEIAYELGQRS